MSEIGFGCGNVGGLMIRGERPERLKAVARAMELGINYFDTAAMYGNGVSEQNLGDALNELRPQVYVGTKVRLPEEDFGDIKGGIQRSVDASLGRMARDSVDLIQLHNSIAEARQSGTTSLSVDDVLGQVVEAFEGLKAQGKVRYYGITGVGETSALHQVVASGAVATVQTPYNLVNPSAGHQVPASFSLQNHDGLIDVAGQHNVGVLVIRVLAGGALGGSEERHSLASPPPAPIGSSASYQEDADRARSVQFLVNEGHAGSLPEAAIRFALAKPQVSSVLVGYSSMEQLEQSVEYHAKGPLSNEALTRLGQQWAEA